MSKFWQVNEDPFYDEDGVLVDEDADMDELEDPTDYVADIEQGVPYFGA